MTLVKRIELKLYNDEDNASTELSSEGVSVKTRLLEAIMNRWTELKRSQC